MTTRPLGVNTWVWTSPLTRAGLARLAPRLRDWGFDLVELPVENLDDFDPTEAAAMLSDLGLGATVALVMPPGRELVDAPAEVVRSTQDYLFRVADIAAELGSPVMAGPAYSSVGRTWRMTEQDRAECYRQLRSHLRPVIDHAGSVGVTLAVEPLNRYETSLLNTVDQTLEALRGLPEEHCGLALDVYHLNIEERDIAAAIRRAGDRIAHVQVCANDRGAPGADHLDWPGIRDALDAVGYAGPLVIESFTADNAAIATAASVWRPLATGQDDLARDGLAFLTSLHCTDKK